MISLVRYIFITCFSLLLFTDLIIAQDSSVSVAERFIEERGEVILEFNRPGMDLLNEISRIISVDYVSEDIVRAYASYSGFLKFLELGLVFTVLDPPGFDSRSPETKLYSDPGFFEKYPDYDEYDSIMQTFAQNYPSLCVLDTFGYSEQGRMLLVVKLSDNATSDEAEPEFFYTSSMHGDETLGFILMLRLIDYFLSNYGTDSRTSNLLDGIELWINPLANPDGFYRTAGRTRYNANGVDLNRNFPDPRVGANPDGNDYQAETLAMMQFMESRNFVMSANFHSGAEVVNYPWDTWSTRHADDDWFQFISHEYADTVQDYSTGYMTGFNDGITNGFDWYMITGGRQDYVTYYLQGRETTIELDNDHYTPESQLNDFWEYNYRSLLNYAYQASYGIQGVVTDSVTGLPLEAMIELVGHDFDSSMVFSESGNGLYVRLLNEGSYELTFTSEGYYDRIISGVGVVNYQTTILDVKLVPSGTLVSPIDEAISLEIFPNPVSTELQFRFSISSLETLGFVIYNIMGQQLLRISQKEYVMGQHTLSSNISNLPVGIFFLEVQGAGFTIRKKFVKSNH
ncbi:MAG: M14 family zinc carboxypeptidase [Bacteroidota bacterium]|nr:M14 family zinc carboxypeptidase [Bacteroidota bacterium]